MLLRFRFLIVTCLFVLGFSQHSFSQSADQEYNVYISKPGIKQMTKEEFLKVDSLNVVQSGFKVCSYTIVVTGIKGSDMEFRTIDGNKITEAAKALITDSCTITIDEIKVSSNSPYHCVNARPFVLEIKP